MNSEPDNKECPHSPISDKQRRLAALEQALIASTKRPTIELSFAEVRKKGLLAVLHKQAGRR